MLLRVCVCVTSVYVFLHVRMRYYVCACVTTSVYVLLRVRMPYYVCVCCEGCTISMSSEDDVYDYWCISGFKCLHAYLLTVSTYV